MFKIVLLFAALLVPGYALGKAKMLEECSVLSFGNLLMYVAMPFLVFSKLIEIDFSGITLSSIAISALMPVALELTLLFFCHAVFVSEERKKRAAMFCAVFPNCGFLGIPLASAMWSDKPEIVLYLSIFNVVSTFLLLTLGIYILSGDKKNISFRRTLASPIFFAILLGVVASGTGIGNSMPLLFTYSKTLAQLTTPLAMTVLGYELSKLDLVKMWCNVELYTASLARLVISPGIAIIILALLKFVLKFNVGENVIAAMLVATAVSTATSAPAMAKKYGADSEHAACLTLGNTLLCVLTLPLAYTLCVCIFN